MRSSAMTRRFRAFSVVTLAGASVLVFHSATFAQQTEPAAPAAKDADAAKPAAEAVPKAQPPQDLPPEYAPPPGYRHGPPQPPPGYPPPGYGPYYQDYYEPQGYPPPPPRHYRPRPYYQPAPSARYYPEPLTYRPFFFGFGLGVGGVSVVPNDTSVSTNASRAGLGYTLRFGFGVSPRWSIVLSGDGAQAYFSGASVSETAWTIGPQVFITPKLYARAGIGAATYSQDNSYCDSYGCYGGTAADSGMATTAAIGFEFMQHYHSALALEAVGTLGYFPNKDKVSTFGLNFVLNLF
jgi:hypothetical protein